MSCRGLGQKIWLQTVRLLSLHSDNKLIDDLVVTFLPFRILSRLMLETSLKGIHRLDGREKMIAQGASEKELETNVVCQDMDMLMQFGKFTAY